LWEIDLGSRCDVLGKTGLGREIQEATTASGDQTEDGPLRAEGRNE